VACQQWRQNDCFDKLLAFSIFQAVHVNYFGSGNGGVENRKKQFSG
jgi:hypothetical protein